MSEMPDDNNPLYDPPTEFVPRYSPTMKCHYNPDTGEIVATDAEGPINTDPKQRPTRKVDSDTGEVLDTAVITKPGIFVNGPRLVLPKSDREIMTTGAKPLKKGKGLKVQADVTGFSSMPKEQTAILTISLGKNPIQHFSIKVPYQVGMSLTSRPIDIIITPSE